MRYRRHLEICTALLIISTLGVFPSRATAEIVAMSDFSVNDEGWLLSGNSTTSTPTYFPTIGRPGGYLNGVDSVVGEVWFWQAPAKFLGNDSSSYGYNLTYDLRDLGDGTPSVYSDVILDGAGIELHLTTTHPVPTFPVWTSYTVHLSETAGWKVGSLSGASATQADVKAVLSNLTQLRIRGAFIPGPVRGSLDGNLDNVVLNGAATAVPVPGTLTLAGLFGAFGLFARTVHRRNRSKMPN